MKIEGRYLLMSDSEINDIVDPDLIEDIRRSDPHPLLKAFVVGHEGESKGRLIGFGNVVKNWLKGAIQMMHEKIQLGTKVFFLHNADNSQEGRESIGEIVGKSLQTIKDRLSVVAVTYIKPRFKDMKLDVASLETDLKIDRVTNEAQVLSVDGLALGDSSKHKPGFPGASLVAQMQFFYENQEKGGSTVLTLEEIRAGIKEGKFKADDVFDRSDIEKVDFVIGFRKSRDRVNDKFDEERVKWEAKEKDFVSVDKIKSDLEAKIAERDVKLNKYRVKEISAPLLKVRNLDEKQLKFVNKKLEEFSPKSATDEELKVEINSQADAVLKEFDDLAGIFGVKKSNNKEEKEGVGPGESDNSDTEDMTNPKNNDMIPSVN